MLCVSTLGRVEAEQASNSQSTKQTPFVSKLLKAKTRAEFREVLLGLSLISPFDRLDDKTIDAAMAVAPSRRIVVFHCVHESASGDMGNEAYFKIFSDLPKEEVIELFEAVSLFFPNTTDQYERKALYNHFKSLKTGKRIKLAKYIKGIMPFDMKDKPRHFVESITRLQEDDLPDVMGRVMSIAELSDDGISDLIKYVSYVPKERRDFILGEAKKLTTSQMNTIDKAHLIDGLDDLRSEDFSDIVALGKQLFFEDTPGGHKSLTFRIIQNMDKDKRKQFVSHLKPLLKAQEPFGLRLDIIQTLAKFEESDRFTFISYLPSNINTEIKNKIFDNLLYVRAADMKKILSDITENLPKKPATEEALLSTILSSIQRVKLNT